MMTNDRTIFIDTNVLVYANLAQSPFYKQATERLQAFSEQGYELWISRQVLREYLAAMTRQNTLTDIIPTASLIEDVRNFSTSFRVAEDGPRVTERLFALMEGISIGGSQVHDANIVATMQSYGIQHLLTHNIQDFNRFSQIITILPLASESEDR
jgi:predicted nucleic acid-binding protein